MTKPTRCEACDWNDATHHIPSPHPHEAQHLSLRERSALCEDCATFYFKHSSIEPLQG